MARYPGQSQRAVRPLPNDRLRQKILRLSASTDCKVTAQIDLTGTGHWVDYKTFELKEAQLIDHIFAEELQAYWIRFVSDQDTTITAQLIYTTW